MKFKLVALSCFIIFIFGSFTFTSSQNFNYYTCSSVHSRQLSTLDDRSDALDNITNAESMVFGNFELLIGAELNGGEVVLLYLSLSVAVNYLNLAQQEFYNGNYSVAISYASLAHSYSQSILPVSLLKGFESLKNKEFFIFILPAIIISIILTVIFCIILVHYARKFYLRRKDQKDLLKKKIIIPKKE